jgi:16S rRNA (adenine1518-N6/adenine1519-N6)-dimethyltransferase
VITDGLQVNKHIARKRFGQHFLTDQAIIDAIVRAIDPRAGQPMVEIGPGLAAMTQPLLERVGQMGVIELDRDLAARLQTRTGLEVVQADVLTVDFSAWARRWGRGRLRVVGNLPYNISSPILFHLLNHVEAIADQHFMLQQEVVDRMVAQPCTGAYGRLSVMLQWRYDMESVLYVPPSAFDPPPRVDSAVVRMAFSQRRKLLRHSLGRWLQTQGAETAFDLQRRAEEVPVEEYVALSRALEAAGVSAGRSDQAAASQ